MASRNVVNTKLVLLGNTSVGKSCLVVQFVRKEWYDYQEPTIGAAFLQQSVTLDDVTVKYEIWDTAGQERYRSLAPMYYRGAGAAIVVYDITNKESFDGAKSWITELQRRGDKNCIIALAGNKSDMAEEREVHTDVRFRCFTVIAFMVFTSLYSIFRKLWNMLRKWESSSKKFQPRQGKM
eukprot:gb/GECG01005468.1/.p1 GENE.gb/GECG01005468.1/~~gb/GECG01005468.1/.p1  ORF type:complete len:180 (+),score=20.44 gb/GECG01005468.1/:1-540(+)